MVAAGRVFGLFPHLFTEVIPDTLSSIPTEASHLRHLILPKHRNQRSPRGFFPAPYFGQKDHPSKIIWCSIASQNEIIESLGQAFFGSVFTPLENGEKFLWMIIFL